MKKIGIIHYDEIGLKGDNRKYFEQALNRNINQKLQAKSTGLKARLRRGYITIGDEQEWDDTAENIIKQIANTTPGIATWGVGLKTEKKIEEIYKAAITIAEQTTFNTFRVTTTRQDKQFEKTSMEISTEVGGAIFEHFNKKGEEYAKGVDLKNFDVEIRVEILQEEVLVYIKNIGMGGLPVGSSGRAVVLLSGGIDSPVAAIEMAKRGIEPLLIHFHARPQTTLAALEKVQDLAQQVAVYTGGVKLAMVSFLETQNTIILSVPEKLRVLFYRRYMMKIAERWGGENGVKAIITGESVGQVASQTLENMHATGSVVTSMPILRPLAGMNKNEIIILARKYNTYELSIQKGDDCCTLQVPVHPETKAKMEDVEKGEQQLNSDELVEKAMENIEVEEY